MANIQSAMASLRRGGPTKAVKCDDGSCYYGIGTEDFALSGNYEFQVVTGAVVVCGISIAAGPAFYHVAAPVPPFPYFKPVHAHSETQLHPVEALKDYGTVLLIRASEKPSDVTAIAPPYKSLWHPLQRLGSLQESTLFEIPKSWTSVDSTAHRYVVLGPKNSGKSSLSRYLCNKAAQKGRVFYMELDPGQPEFTPPGFITLHEIEESYLNFSPPYSHPGFLYAVKSHHLGYPSPMETPHRYLAMCESLFTYYLELAQPSDVLVVNTPGWTKGLGLELNTSIAQMALPAEVIHMGPSDFLDRGLNIKEVAKIELHPEGTSTTTITAGGYSSAELRALQIIAYFHEHDSEPLTNWAPYELPLGTNSAGILGFAVLDSAGIDLEADLGTCVEGTLVSINVVQADASLQPGILSEEQADSIWQISNCVGFAVVQHLSRELEVVRILSPVDPAALDLGNKRIVLCRGRIQLPIWEIHNRSLEGPLPWISTTKAAGIGGSYTKFRRNLLR